MLNDFDINTPNDGVFFNNITEIHSCGNTNGIAFAALKDVQDGSGSVVTWGYNDYGGDSSIHGHSLQYNYVESVQHYLNDNEITKKNIKQNFKIKGQIVNSFNRLVGVVLQSGLFVPVKLSSKFRGIPIITKIPSLNYKKTLQEIATFNTKSLVEKLVPSKKIVDGNDIAGILLNTGRIIPVVKIAISKIKNSLKINQNTKHYNINLYQYETANDNRVIQMKKLKYQTEAYQRLRFEMAKIIQKNKLVDMFMKLIHSKKSKNDKRKELIRVLTKITKLFFSPVKKEIQIKDLKIPNIRRTCENLKKCDDLFCASHKKKCYFYFDNKLFFNPKFTLNTFIKMIAEDILNNPFKRKIILADKISFVIDRTIFRKHPNEIEITGDNIRKIINKLYSNKSKIKINFNKRYNVIKEDQFDKIVNNIYNSNIRGKVQTNIIQDHYELEDLPLLWKSKFNKNKNKNTEIKVVDMGYKRLGVYNILLWLKNKTNEVEVNGNTRKQLARNFVEYLDKLNNNEIKNLLKLVVKEIEFKKLKVLVKSKNDNLLLKIYQTMYPEEFTQIDSQQELFRYIKSTRYTNNLVDCLFLSKMLELNIVVLNNRLTKNNPKGYTTILTNRDKPILTLLKEKRTGYILFQLVIQKIMKHNKDCNYLFSIDKLKKIIR